MKVFEKPIEMVAWFDKNGMPTPIRFRMENRDESYITIGIDKIITKEKIKIAGSYFMAYTCQSNIRGVVKTFELRFELNTMKWILFKI